MKIGIIGTENSHAMAFSKLLNLPDPNTGKVRYEDARVAGVYGPDMETAQAIMDMTHVDFIAGGPEDFFGRVDAMMITCRRGSEHYQYAMPFIRKGIPCFIDKPFTTDYEQAAELIGKAKENHVPLSGGSGCKYVYDVLMLKRQVENLVAENKFITASMNFSLVMDSVYDGFFFYSSHLTEMALAAFGYDMKSVNAFEKNGSVITVAHYENFDITLNYTDGSHDSSCIIFSKERNFYRQIDISMLFEHEMDHFINVLKTGKMQTSYEDLIKPVAVLVAVNESFKTGKEVAIK